MIDNILCIRKNDLIVTGHIHPSHFEMCGAGDCEVGMTVYVDAKTGLNGPGIPMVVIKGWRVDRPRIRLEGLSHTAEGIFLWGKWYAFALQRKRVCSVAGNLSRLTAAAAERKKMRN